MYEHAGNYSVNLTVSYEYGNFSTVKKDYIRFICVEEYLKNSQEYPAEMIRWIAMDSN
jgi:PKD repeat protein